MQEVKCTGCNSVYMKYYKKITERNFCSRQCQHLWFKGKTYEEIHGEETATEIKHKLSLTSSGENNGNFGNKWSNEQREKQSKTIKTKMDEMGENWRKENCGKSNRGLQRSKEFIENWHKTQNTPGYVKPPMSNETKQKIGKSSKERMTSPKMISHIRKINEDLGNWVPINEKTNFEIYFKSANWIYRMWDLIEDSAQLDLLKTFGIFNCRTNTKGVVRDHIFSRKDGFLIGVFPEILRHPCNCQILTHADNVAKKKNRYEDRSDIELEILFEKIQKYTKFWSEQDLVLSLIQQYKEGQRWINPNI